MAKKVIDVLTENMCSFKMFVRMGKVPQSVMVEYQIYSFYKTLENMPSKMDRYQFTAEQLKVNVMQVRRAVSSMEKTVTV